MRNEVIFVCQDLEKGTIVLLKNTIMQAVNFKRRLVSGIL